MIIDEGELRMALGIDATISAQERALLTMLHPEAEAAVKRVLRYDPQQRERTEFYPRARPDGHHNPVEGRYESTGLRAVFVQENVEGTLVLEHIPVRSVSALRVDYSGRYGQAAGAFPADTAWTLGTDFYLDLEQSGICKSGILIAERGWPQIPGSIKVTYTAGYSADEFSGRDTTNYVDASAIKSAVLETFLVSWHRTYATRKKTGVGFVPGAFASERLGDYGYSLGGGASQVLAGLVVDVPPSAKHRLEPFIHYGNYFLA
jgi:hypothetical protein